MGTILVPKGDEISTKNEGKPSVDNLYELIHENWFWLA